MRWNMAASMARACMHFSLPRQCLVDTVWKEQSVNCRLQTFCLSYSQYQCYHATHVLLKKRRTKDEKDLKRIIKDQFLKDSYITIKENAKQILPTVEIWNNIRVKKLAESMKKNVDDVLDFLHIKHKDINLNENSLLPIALASEVAKGCNMKIKVISMLNKTEELTYEDILKRSPPDESVLVKRPPVVTIMGHVDHGKTTLLDALRHTSVVQSEFGGITQHIGAFNVTLKSGEQVTFLDTPGHAAFASMRYRGAHVTDIVVLVVAADDGVKDQTVQSIEMAKSANVPIIVALNKIDKSNANIKRAQVELANNGVIVEDQGGDVQCVQISALKGINLEELTETIVLQAEIMNLRGDPTGLVEAVTIECSNDIRRGKLVTALIQRGTLKKGCLLVSGLAWAKVRAMFNDAGRPILKAKPSEAVQIIGWKAFPTVGDEILEVENDKTLQIVLKHREDKQQHALAIEHKVMAEKREEEHIKEYQRFLKVKQFFGKDKEVMKQIRKTKVIIEKQKMKTDPTDDLPTLNVVIKADVAGSVEAILDAFDRYKNDDKCHLNVIHYGIGSITDTDVQLAETFNAIIYGFNVNMTKQLEEETKKKDVTVRFYNVVYKLFDNIIEVINSKLPNVDIEEVLGEAEVQQQFQIKEKKKKVFIAGCRCVEGVLVKSALFKVIRENEVIYKGKLVSMKHLKEEVSTIQTNVECGLRFEDSSILFQPKDKIICYELRSKPQTIDWDLGF